jgi:hypothetical protein
MAEENQHCENLERCPVFKYFRKFAKQIYIDIYCEGDYVICRRRQLWVEGKPVPENLLPHGGTLWDSDKV